MSEINDMMYTSQDSVSLGQQLKRAREALNLSIEDVAKKTNLKKAHIESLENDIFILPNVAPTFVRGYVRNYTRFLNLPETLVASVNYGAMTVPKEVTKVATTDMTYKSQGRWVKYLTVLVLLGAAGMTLLWWWQDHQKEQENREHLVRTAEVKPVPVPAPERAESGAGVSATDTTAVPVTAEAEQTVSEVTTAEGEQTAPLATEQTTTSAPSAEMPVLSNPAENEAAEVTETVDSQPVAVGNDDLRIEITGKESWITVKGSKSAKSLVEKVYSNGEVLTFNDHEEYRLTIGAPANVKLYYKGREVPLKIDGRVARIKLPSAQ